MGKGRVDELYTLNLSTNINLMFLNILTLTDTQVITPTHKKETTSDTNLIKGVEIIFPSFIYGLIVLYNFSLQRFRFISTPLIFPF